MSKFDQNIKRSQNNNLLIKPSHTSTNAENLVKISQVDSEISCLAVGPLKRLKKKNTPTTGQAMMLGKQNK